MRIVTLLTKVDLRQGLCVKRTIQPLGELVMICGRSNLIQHKLRKLAKFVLQDMDQGLALDGDGGFRPCTHRLG